MTVPTRVPPWLSPFAAAIGVLAVLGVIDGVVTGSVLTVGVWAAVATLVALRLYVRRARMRRRPDTKVEQARYMR